MRFDLTDLRLMVQVAEANSVTGGAQALSLSVPAASTRIKNLEEGLGTRLLRTSQGVTLTPPEAMEDVGPRAMNFRASLFKETSPAAHT